MKLMFETKERKKKDTRLFLGKIVNMIWKNYNLQPICEVKCEKLTPLFDLKNFLNSKLIEFVEKKKNNNYLCNMLLAVG